jgi:hypothetical protein
MILDHRGEPVAIARMGFVPSAPVLPRRPPAKDGEQFADAIGFSVATDEEPYEALEECE